MNNVLRLKKNLLGRDIIVTDVHGCFLLLKESLVHIDFDKNRDRLIIAGDLVDRGPNSYVAAKWVAQKWCFAAIGNHDAQFAFHKSLKLFKQSLACFPVDPWFVDISEEEYNAFCAALRKHLYPAIEIETVNGLVGIVHGELPLGNNWGDLVNRLNNKDYDFLHDCIWSRELSKIAQNLNGKNEQDYHVPDVAHLFHGHSPSRKLDYKPYKLANRYYIDTAAFKAENPDKYPTAGITLFDVNNPLEPLYCSSQQ